MPLWLLEDGIQLARKCEPIAISCGYHVALGGGTLLRGWSDKDLDLFFYPHGKAGNGQWEKLLSTLPAAGLTPVLKMDTKEYPADWIYRANANGKRVDIFILDRRAETVEPLIP